MPHANELCFSFFDKFNGTDDLSRCWDVPQISTDVQLPVHGLCRFIFDFGIYLETASEGPALRRPVFAKPPCERHDQSDD